MSNENHGSVKGEAAPMTPSPSGSTSSQGSPAPLSPSTSKSQELPDELVQAGWSKCWSKRENRPYYFNRFTNQSLWEVPVLGQHDVISDPLGLNAAPAEGGAGGGGDAAGDLGNGQRKRRASEEQGGAGSNSLKRPKVEPATPISPSTPGVKPWSAAPDEKQSQSAVPTTPSPAPVPYRPAVIYWDLDIQTNAVIRERPPAPLLSPHPDIELQRAQLTTKLRQHYTELCYQREGIEPPRESFNRWLLERKVIDKGPDPLLPSECEPVISTSMFREVMNDIPIRLCRIKYKEEARKLLFKYAEAAKKMIDSRNASPDSRKVVKWNAEDTMNWLRRDTSASKEDYMDRLEHLRQQCGPHVASVAKESVEGICSKIYHISAEYSRRLRLTHLALMKDNNVNTDVPEEPAELKDKDHLVYCYPVRLSVPSPPHPRVELHFENDVACLRFKGEMVKLSRGHFTKLELLYRYSCIDDPRFEKFLSRVWCLVKRYQVMFGAGINEGTGLQGALPVPVFEALHKHFGVSFECFASPLNCYFKQFCSAFPDIDGYFGSRGTFLSFSPVSGSFEANPPFCEELMDAMVARFEELLESSSEPLSFIVFVPDWREPMTAALTRMEASRFLRHSLTVPAFQHQYRSGSQHICKKEDMHYQAVHGTVVLFLQNAGGFSRWEPNPERIAELLASYRTAAAAAAAANPNAPPGSAPSPSTPGSAPPPSPSSSALTSPTPPAAAAGSTNPLASSPSLDTTDSGAAPPSRTPGVVDPPTTSSSASSSDNHDNNNNNNADSSSPTTTQENVVAAV